jgi:hypothetical protein
MLLAVLRAREHLDRFGRHRPQLLEVLASRWLGRLIDRVQVQAGGDGHAAADGAGDRAAVGVQPEDPLDGRPLAFVGGQPVGDMDTP